MVIDCLQLLETKAPGGEETTSFPKSWYTAFSFSWWILKNLQKFNTKRLNQSENIPKSFRGRGYFL